MGLFKGIICIHRIKLNRSTVHNTLYKLATTLDVYVYLVSIFLIEEGQYLRPDYNFLELGDMVF